PLVVQVLWGALFCKLFGTSFTVLRASTLVLALSGVIATYAAARELGARRSVAFVVAAAVAVNPVYLLLSCTFMTDVPFFALAAVALWGFVRALRRGSSSALVVATVASVLATLIRQFGLVLPVAF